MELKIKTIKDKQTWENFIKSCEEYTFLHSWNWGEFSKLMGHKIFRLGIFKKEELIGVALIVKIAAKRGTFLFCPHGPILRDLILEGPNRKQVRNSQLQILNTLVDFLKELARDEGCSFIRISPLLQRNKENEKIFKELGFRIAPIHIHAESTLLLDITKEEEELLRKMRKTTRYLIRRMEKEGVEVETEDPALGEHFLRLQDEVVKRKHFVAFSEKQIKNEIYSFVPDNELVIFNAKYNGEVVASSIIIYYGYRSFYYQSASSGNKKISAPYLILWRAIQEAKKRGCRVFDFYGASPVDKPNHPWSGPTLFKQGFGGERVDYLPAQDLVLNWKYWITYIIETVRRIKRGF